MEIGVFEAIVARACQCRRCLSTKTFLVLGRKEKEADAETEVGAEADAGGRGDLASYQRARSHAHGHSHRGLKRGDQSLEAGLGWTLLGFMLRRPCRAS